ncbi:MAG: GreA/GreB family elongation factor [Candidatus Aureabacteria bacterium]|nr:GreA/GreB family elongation factor [Candidatus Auribacterota bacterium]
MANYMTRASFERIYEELKQIQEKDIPQISKAKLQAAQEGDLSENAEYIGCKEKLDQLHARYANLQKRIAGVSYIDDLKIPCSVVSVGTKVELEEVEKKEKITYTLLGSEDVDLEKRIISISSPIAKSMIGKRVGDEIGMRTEEIEKKYRILSIRHFREN